MTTSRALLGTALCSVLSLAMVGCTTESSMGPTPSPAQANHMAAASIQLAQAEITPVVLNEPQAPVVQKGTVLWRRAGDEADLIPTPKVSEELRRLRETLSQMQGLTSQQLSTLEQQIQGTKAEQAQALATIREEQSRTGQELRAQTAEAVTSVASMAKQGMQSMEGVTRTNAENWSATTTQVAQLENRLQGTVGDLRETRNETSRQLAAQKEAQAAILAAQTEAQSARLTALSQQLAAQDDMQATRLAAHTQVQAAQVAALSTQVAANQQLTSMQLAQLEKITSDNRALAQSETSAVGAALRQYADARMREVVASTSSTILNLARASDQTVAALDARTSQRLKSLYAAANTRAEQLAEQKAGAVAKNLVVLQQQTDAQRLTPEQIRQISEETVTAATPEFRALALQTMQQSQDYIRTVARTAVQDKDPAMQTALAEAARDVITKDDRVVFAIRKAVADELEGAVTGETPTRTELGGDRTASGDDNLDPNRLRIAQLLAPGSNKAAADAAPTDTQLAAISPAAGEAAQDGSWAAQGTSLTRSRVRADWMDIRQYKVVVHEDDQTLEQLLSKVLKHAEPFTGPWQVRWKVSAANKEIMTETFSLDAETTFEDFVSYLAQYVVNDRGVKLTFNLFDNERVIVISD